MKFFAVFMLGAFLSTIFAFALGELGPSGTAAPFTTQTVNGCVLTQPVYAGTELVGGWSATLRYGQSVNLPDGDTATCTPGELLVG